MSDFQAFLPHFHAKSKVFEMRHSASSPTMVEFWLVVGIESLIWLAIVYAYIFLMAKKGILIFSCKSEELFNKRKYLSISAIFAIIFSISAWTIRFCMGDFSDVPVGYAICACGLIYLITFIIAFLVAF